MSYEYSENILLPESFDENSINDCRERVYEYVYLRYPAVAV